MFRSTVVVRSLCKYLIFCLVFVFVACEYESSNKQFDSIGFGIDNSSFSISPMELDSITFANGDVLWLLRGSIQDGSCMHRYQLICNDDPRCCFKEIVRSTPPLIFDKKDVECIITNVRNVFEITWRTNKQRIYLKTSLTSRH